MFSPTKENTNVRINSNIHKKIIRGRRKIKTNEEIKNYNFSISK